MYAVIRRYTFNPGASAEISKKINEGFLPMLKKMPGFVAYNWIETTPGACMSVSIFHNRSGTDESVRLAAEFVHTQLSNSGITRAEVFSGEVRAHG